MNAGIFLIYYGFDIRAGRLEIDLFDHPINRHRNVTKYQRLLSTLSLDWSSGLCTQESFFLTGSAQSLDISKFFVDFFIYLCLIIICVFDFIFQMNRRAMIAATDEFGSTVGIRAWRSLLRRLQEMEALFGTFANQMGPGPRVRMLFSPLLVLV